VIYFTAKTHSKEQPTEQMRRITTPTNGFGLSSGQVLMPICRSPPRRNIRRRPFYDDDTWGKALIHPRYMAQTLRLPKTKGMFNMNKNEYEQKQTASLEKTTLVHHDSLTKTKEQAADWLITTGGDCTAAMKLAHQHVKSLFPSFKTNEGKTTAYRLYNRLQKAVKVLS